MLLINQLGSPLQLKFYSTTPMVPLLVSANHWAITRLMIQMLNREVTVSIVEEWHAYTFHFPLDAVLITTDSTTLQTLSTASTAKARRQ